MKLSRTRGLNVLAALSAALLVGCGGGSDSDVATFTDTSSFNPQQPVSDWQLVWNDEFSGSQVNTSNWTVLDDDCAGGGNNERQCYTTNAKNVFVQDGNLNIVAMRAEEGASQPYTSARLNSKNKGDFKYGRFEIRAQLPKGQGAWPAIWMKPTDEVYGAWPRSGEIDIVEAVNLEANRSDGTLESHVHGTLHYGKMKDDGSHSSGKSYMLPDGVNPADDFHIYALEWNEGEMRWYVDNYLYATQRKSEVITNSKGQLSGLRHKGWHAQYHSPLTGEMDVDYSGAPFDQEFHLIMNLAVGGNWPEGANDTGVDASAFANGQTLMIDYVRVYECSMNPETGKGCETVRAGYDMLEGKHPTAALLEGDTPVPVRPAGPSIENLKIFDGTPNPNWQVWDCCGDSNPELVADPERGDVYELEVGATPTVLGFNSRTGVIAENVVSKPFDASLMAADGSLSFDMKVVAAPDDATAVWLLKVESNGDAKKFVELSLSDSDEGAVPAVGGWQTYTFALSDLQDAGTLDLSAIDVLMIFPTWGLGKGAVYQLDNVQITSPSAAIPSLDIFINEENTSWPFWDCCGETEPVVVVDEDTDHGNAIEFTVVGEAVLGFNARPDYTDAPQQFDASSLMADGVVQFDLKVMNPTSDASTPWLMKIESDNNATNVQVDLTTSIEGAAPSSEWQTYTFSVAELVNGGLDASAIDVLLIFPAWGSGDGAVYRVDNVRIFDPTASGGEFNGHVLFKDGELDAWALWDCCGGSTPTVVADDLGHGAVARFEVGADPTVLGMNSRADIATAPSQIDASSLLTDGVLQFEMKVVTAPTNPDSTWLMKIESDNTATELQVELVTSVEGAEPVVGVWQTYTFNLSDLSSDGLDVSAIDVVMVFPAWATGEGAVYFLDNVMIYDPNSLPTRKGITLFENGQTDWAMWDCCGGSTPTVEVDDYDHGTVAEFVVGSEPTVMGFNARPDISANPTNYDASALLADGYLRFEMKVITAPTNADSTWLMKIESDNAATELQVELATSVEGADPVVGVWQTYTFNLSDLSAAGLDVSAIDVVMVFPAWATGEGAVYRIDNMVISAP
ncbi:family 16 glycosylhydrolase [Porticoccaceae bacterium]|nr:family 16 glycosylhydrolase [Porticoccaceae bacterium]